jgi:UDP-2,3-diacylglucosamine pyrophosphatase LpxH
MSADRGHQAVLDALFSLKQASLLENVWLLSRLKASYWLDPLDSSEILFFIPDLHLVSCAQENAFSYSFNQVTRTQRIARQRLLEALVRALVPLRQSLAASGRTFRTYQLGNFIDFWRQGDFELLQRTTAKPLAADVLNDYESLIRPLASRTNGLGAQFANGNHDPFLGELDELNTKRGWFAYNQTTFRPHVLITHGDLFDPLERGAPEALRERALRRFGPEREASTYACPTPAATLRGSKAPCLLPSANAALDPVVNVNSVRAHLDGMGKLTPTSVNELRETHELLPEATRTVLALRSGDNATKTRLELPLAQAELRLVVVGHSHHPRTVSVTGPDGGPLFTLLDVGAWLENVRINEGAAVPSQQIGVVCGDDIRIYQLEAATTLFS